LFSVAIVLNHTVSYDMHLIQQVRLKR